MCVCVCVCFMYPRRVLRNNETETEAYNYYQNMIITIMLPITHLIQINNIVLDSFLRFTNQIILNKLYLYYMYPIIYISGHYYIFKNYLYLKNKTGYGISLYITCYNIV